MFVSDKNEGKEHDADELDAQDAEELPDREVMSVKHPGPHPIAIEPPPPDTI